MGRGKSECRAILKVLRGRRCSQVTKSVPVCLGSAAFNCLAVPVFARLVAIDGR